MSDCPCSPSSTSLVASTRMSILGCTCSPFEFGAVSRSLRFDSGVVETSDDNELDEGGVVENVVIEIDEGTEPLQSGAETVANWSSIFPQVTLSVLMREWRVVAGSGVVTLLAVACHVFSPGLKKKNPEKVNSLYTSHI